MGFDDEEGCDRDDRTIYVAGLSEKMNEKLLYELFHQAGRSKKYFCLFLV